MVKFGSKLGEYEVVYVVDKYKEKLKEKIR